MSGFENLWCISKHKSNNLWSNYRMLNRTFYFLIDTNKPIHDEKHLVVIQRDTDLDGGDKYRLTTRRYDQDPIVKWEELVQLFPGLDGYEDVFKPVPYSVNNELNGTPIGERRDIIELLTEDENNERYWIGAQLKPIVMRYIGAGNNITKASTWRVFSGEAKYAYLNQINANNYLAKINNSDLLNAILDTSRNLLNSVLNNHELTLTDLHSGLMQNNYEIGEYKNIEDNNIIIIRNRTTNNLGIMDNNNGQWYKKDNIIYIDNYKATSTRFYNFKYDQKEKFIVVTYTSEEHPNENYNFYCVIPYSKNNRKNGYLLSHDAFEKMEINFVEGSVVKSLGKKPEEVRDINEKDLQ
jgi:hypothetical protein